MKEYSLNTNPICNKDAVIKGEKYRFTIFTPSLVRMEYCENGMFEDRATQSVINRNFEVPKYTVTENEGIFKIETEELEIIYDKKIFSAKGLSVKVKSVKNSIWHYGDELHDLLGTCRTLDDVNGPAKLGHGLLSREGFSVIDDSTSMALTEDGWIEPRTENIDLYFFGYGHRYLECLSDFYHLCGKTPLLPRYALGNWWSRYYRYTEKEYKELMNRFEREKLPFTVAVIDMDWHLVDDVDPKYGSGWTGYTWNKNFFPDPEEFMKWLHDKGLKVTLNVHPADGIRAFEELYPKVATAMGIDPAEEQPVEFDPANRKFMEVYFDVLCHELEKQGVDFWWIDWQQGTESKLPGLDPLWMLNHYHYLDSGWKGNRQITFSRYAGVGSHRYPVGFSGDTHITWESLDYQPYFTNTASNIGYGWWSHDIGGHMQGYKDDELMARWVQYGVFSPINRLHSSDNPFNGKEPWRYGAATREVMENYLRLRHSMIPYLYTMNRRASRENLPLIQPMYYLWPEKEEAYEVPNEYYFGTELLVMPITKPADKISLTAKADVWLPEGLWADFFTGIVYEGGKMQEMWRNIHDIPVLMKAGAIVPMQNMEQYDNSVENPHAMEVKIFPAADGEFVLWEDSGDSLQDLDENWASTKLSLQVGNVNGKAVFSIGKAEGNVSILPEKRSWKLVFVATKDTSVTVTTSKGTEIEVLPRYDEETQSLFVEIPEVEIDCGIDVIFVAGLQMAEKNITQRIMPILERAQMSNNAKEHFWKELRKQPEKLTDLIKTAEFSESVKKSLLEIILA